MGGPWILLNRDADGESMRSGENIWDRRSSQALREGSECLLGGAIEQKRKERRRFVASGAPVMTDKPTEAPTKACVTVKGLGTRAALSHWRLAVSVLA